MTGSASARFWCDCCVAEDWAAVSTGLNATNARFAAMATGGCNAGGSKVEKAKVSDGSPYWALLNR